MVSLDWMRGIVMVLMAIDHASVMFNPERAAADSAGLWVSGTEIPLAQFFTRWVTHLCAPTFLFLAGTAIALSSRKRIARGEGRSVDRDLLIRGALLIGFDVIYMTNLAGLTLLLQVLYAIGASMILMVPLRRLGPGALALVGIGWFVVGEWVTGLVWSPPTEPELGWAMLFAPYHGENILIPYPAVPWLAMMMLGWAFGEWLARRERPPVRELLLAGTVALTVFVVIRGLNGYGNMFLLREDASLVQWLHASKYPPSASFAAMELGVLFVALAGLMWIEPRVKVHDNGPILVFGQTALFFYLLHFALLGAPAMGLGLWGKGGLWGTYLATLCVLAVLYPLCRWYRSRKRASPRSWLRYI